MDKPIQHSPGLALLAEEFFAASRELDKREDLTPVQQWKLNKEIVHEYKLRCAQERKIAQEQMLEDNTLLRRSQGW